MKKKEEVENLIYGELNAEKPDESVLNAAKMQIETMQTESEGGGVLNNGTKRRNVCGGTIVGNNTLAKRSMVVAACAVFAIAIILCCSLPFVLRREEIAGDNEFTPREISSISSYDDNLLYLDYEIESSVLYSDYDNSPVYILELYNDNQNQIALYVLLDTDRADLEIFENFSELSQSFLYGETAVSYGICGGEYAAAFSYNGCNYYISAEVESDELILLYVQELLSL